MHSPRHRTPLICIPALLATFLTPVAMRSQEAQATFHFVTPSFDLSWTRGAPDARGGGVAMSGTGVNLVLGGGASGVLGPLRYRFVPMFVFDQNSAPANAGRASGDPSRNEFASPFYFGDNSADLPSRPGSGSLVRLMPGESALWWTGRRASIAVTSSTPQWGPGLGEGIVLGRSAPGVARVEAALAWRPSPGIVRLRWFGGVARESEWFDSDADNDSRVLSGSRLEFERAGLGESLGRLTAGVSRTVMNAPGRGTLAAVLQPFVRTAADSVIEFLSADFSMSIPRAGSSAWLELARQAPMRGLGEFLRMPTEGMAFRTGFRQRLVRSAAAEWTLEVEFVRLDQSGTRTGEAPMDLYTSGTVIHGWTHHGRPLGSGLGPGGQRQFAQLERLGQTWRLGGFLERVRWNEGAMFREPTPESDLHDVTLQAGIVAGRRIAGYDVRATLSAGERLNYLFQGASSSPDGTPVDLTQLRFSLSFTPSGGTRRIVGLLPEP